MTSVTSFFRADFIQYTKKGGLRMTAKTKRHIFIEASSVCVKDI